MSSQQPPKDFLALTHGHEWVNFYESFDKLVQDHLSRSSELLRKAMSLPEVADREVAQIRDDLEGKLQTERSRASENLNGLKTDIASTQQQASAIVRMTAMMIGDLDRLAARVETAITDLDATPADAAAIASSTETSDAPSETAPSDETEMAGTTMLAEAESETSAESDSDGEAEAEADEIDLHALAAAEDESTEAETDEGTTNPGTGDLTNPPGTGELGTPGSERSRPHWLSMAKPTAGDSSS